MSEEKGLAFTDMLEEFFTPRIVAALELETKRYVDEIFSDVTVTSNVVYGANIGIITQAPALENLTIFLFLEYSFFNLALKGISLSTPRILRR